MPSPQFAGIKEFFYFCNEISKRRFRGPMVPYFVTVY